MIKEKADKNNRGLYRIGGYTGLNTASFVKYLEISIIFHIFISELQYIYIILF